MKASWDLVVPELEDDPFADLTGVVTDAPDDDAAPQRTRRKRSDAGQSRTGGTVRKPTSKKLTEELLVPWGQLSMALAMMSPTASGVFIGRGEATVGAIVAIAEKHPKMLAALRTGSQIGPAFEIAQTVLMAFLAFQLDLGKMDPDTPFAVAMGVSGVFHEVRGHQPVFNAQQMPPDDVWSVPPPPHQPAAYRNNDPRNPVFSFQAGQGAAMMGGQG